MYRVGQFLLITAAALIILMSILLLFNVVDSKIAGIGIILGLPLASAGRVISKNYRNK